MTIYKIIEKKIAGGELSRQELDFFIEGACAGRVLPEQLGAFLSAVCINGMTTDETLSLTLCMRDSGQTFDLSACGLTVDKHSSGGVGDTVTLIVAPILAVCGLKVAKLSGRGLGHTGGTVDKLEAFEGFNTQMTHDDFVRAVRERGVAVAGQTSQIVPADKLLYAVRDRTATVSSVPLITASIMSKKLAVGADILVFDIKYGSGAFMKTLSQARQLAQTIVSVGRAAGKKTAALVTSMEQPLSRHLGCHAEVNEAVRVLKGKDCSLARLSLSVAGTALALAGLDTSLARGAIESGSAFAKFVQMVEGQGGRFECLLEADITAQVRAEQEGYLSEIDTEALGFCVQSLSDKSCGIEIGARLGDAVSVGSVLATIRGSQSGVAKKAGECFKITGQKPTVSPLIAETIM